jgi:hypothetical protein
MMERMVITARAIAGAIQSCDDFMLLPEAGPGASSLDDNVHIVVLFRAKADSLNEVLVQRINEGNKWYVGGTSWQGKPAVRLAVSSWRAEPEDAAATVRESLMAISKTHKLSQ